MEVSEDMVNARVRARTDRQLAKRGWGMNRARMMETLYMLACGITALAALIVFVLGVIALTGVLR